MLLIPLKRKLLKFGGFYDEILTEPIRWEEGYIIPPEKPELGIEFNEEVLKNHLYTED